MAYSAFKNAMTAAEKKKAWDVLEGFPSFRTKMRVKEKYSCSMRKRTYDWYKKCEDKVKNKKMTFSDCTMLGAEALDFSLEDAFDMRPEAETEPPKPFVKTKVPRVVKDEDYDSCSSGNNDTDDSDDDDTSSVNSDEMQEMTKALNFFGGDAGKSLGKGMGNFLGGAMQGMLGGLFNKDSGFYDLFVARHKNLEVYLEKNRDDLPVAHVEAYETHLALLQEMIGLFSKYENQPLVLQQELNRLDAEVKAIPIPYPLNMEANSEELSEKMLGSMFSGMNLNNTEAKQGQPECCVM